MEDYLRQELQNENYLIFSEYFSGEDKLISLKDKYMIYNIYSDEIRVKELLENDINYLNNQEDELIKLIGELNNIKCTPGKKTVLSQTVKSTMDKYKSVLMDNSLFKAFNFNNATIQKANIDQKLNKENTHSIIRKHFLENVQKLISIRSAMSVDEIKDTIRHICKCNKDIKCEELNTEILIYNPEKIALHIINGVKSYINEILRISNYKDKDKYILFYRGHADMKWKLVPSIYRNQWIKKEDILFKEIIIRNPNEFINSSSTFEKLTKMQHYELPTRLLDITTNSLVALFFACNSSNNTIGEIHVFKVKKEDLKYYNSDTVSVLSNLSRVNFDLNFNLLPRKVEDFNKAPAVRELVNQIREEKSYFNNEIEPTDLCRTLYVKPKLDNERIIRQSGAFILFGIRDDKYSPAELSDIYSSGKIHKYVIPSDKKAAILDELNLFGISYSVLFPEIDKAAAHLKKEYSSK